MVHIYTYELNENDLELRYRLDQLKQNPNVIILLDQPRQMQFMSEKAVERNIGYKPRRKMKATAALRLAFKETMAMRDTLIESVAEVRAAVRIGWRIANAATELKELHEEIVDSPHLVEISRKLYRLEDELNHYVDEAAVALERKASATYGERIKQYVETKLLQ